MRPVSITTVTIGNPLADNASVIASASVAFLVVKTDLPS